MLLQCLLCRELVCASVSGPPLDCMHEASIPSWVLLKCIQYQPRISGARLYGRSAPAFIICTPFPQVYPSASRGSLKLELRTLSLSMLGTHRKWIEAVSTSVFLLCDMSMSNPSWLVSCGPPRAFSEVLQPGWSTCFGERCLLRQVYATVTRHVLNVSCVLSGAVAGAGATHQEQRRQQFSAAWGYFYPQDQAPCNGVAVAQK